MSLDFGRDFSAAMALCKLDFGIVGCGLKFAGVSGLDFHAQRRTPAIGHGHKPG